MNKYEKLIEYIINEQEDKARELFHQIVVEKSRDIYESLIDDEDFEESVGGNAVDSLVDEIEADEQGMTEADMDDMGDEADMDDMDDMGDEADMDDMGDEADMDDMGSEGDVEGRVQDLESALDELKAEFDALMADEEAEEENEPGIHDMDSEDEAEFDMDMGNEDEEVSESQINELSSKTLQKYANKSAQDFSDTEAEADDIGKRSYRGRVASAHGDPNFDDSTHWTTERQGKRIQGLKRAGERGVFPNKKVEPPEDSDMHDFRYGGPSGLREYTEKVAMPSNKSEGGAVGARGENTSVNKQSIVAKKNNMGGTAANIVKGGAEQSPDNKAVPQPSNKYTKGKGNLPGAGSFENVPGAKTKGYEKKATSYEKQRGAEGQTTSGKMPVSSKAVIGSKIR
jgi:hypothetical protein